MNGIEAVSLVLSRIGAPRVKPGLHPVSCATFSAEEYYALIPALREALEQLQQSGTVVQNLTQQVFEQGLELVRLRGDLSDAHKRNEELWIICSKAGLLVSS